MPLERWYMAKGLFIVNKISIYEVTFFEKYHKLHNSLKYKTCEHLSLGEVYP